MSKADLTTPPGITPALRSLAVELEEPAGNYYPTDPPPWRVFCGHRSLTATAAGNSRFCWIMGGRSWNILYVAACA